MRTVPRHVFVPEAPLEDAYANAPVHIKYDTVGTSISCASQPSIVALMLDQLDVQPGQRVLELGAGTGYNAGLLAHLVGENGHVTTLDVDDDLVEGARAHLAAAGITNVEAVTRDGALGYAEEHRTTASSPPSAHTEYRTPGCSNSPPAEGSSSPNASRARSPAPSPTSSATAAGSPSAAR